MARRRKKGLVLEKTQDPGKDLFAYLFLLMMVFSFMLLMTMEERYEGMSGMQGPDKQQASSGKSTLASVDNNSLGRLIKQDGKVYIAFGDQFYNPASDLDRLRGDNRLAEDQIANGELRRLLYLEEGENSVIMLNEYLAAFQNLSNAGINIAFAKVVQ